MGGGGYVAGPVGLAALTLRIPLVLTEADSHLGLTNRLLAPFARRVCLAFPIAGREGARYRVTGRPIPPPRQRPRGRARALRDRRRGDVRARVRRLARGALDQPRGGRGVRGRAVSRAARVRPARLSRSSRRATCRRATTCASTSTWRTSPRRSRPPTSWSRAPGGSVFEIAAHGLPAILVPYPHAAGDHQSGERALDGRRGRGGRDPRRAS